MKNNIVLFIPFSYLCVYNIHARTRRYNVVRSTNKQHLKHITLTHTRSSHSTNHTYTHVSLAYKIVAVGQAICIRKSSAMRHHQQQQRTYDADEAVHM